MVNRDFPSSPTASGLSNIHAGHVHVHVFRAVAGLPEDQLMDILLKSNISMPAVQVFSQKVSAKII